jgi:hypothetical protein
VVDANAIVLLQMFKPGDDHRDFRPLPTSSYSDSGLPILPCDESRLRKVLERNLPFGEEPTSPQGDIGMKVSVGSEKTGITEGTFCILDCDKDIRSESRNSQFSPLVIEVNFNSSNDGDGGIDGNSRVRYDAYHPTEFLAYHKKNHNINYNINWKPHVRVDSVTRWGCTS